MLIVGIDYSINSSGIIKMYLDKNLNQESVLYKGFSTVKKVCNVDSSITYFKKDQFLDNIEKSIWMKDEIIKFIDERPDYVAIEGYALNAKGLVFNIAEATMVLKTALYEHGIPMRIYDPNSIKKFATNFGNADKIRMEDEFDRGVDFEDIKPNLGKLPCYKSPKLDIIDAFFIAKLLQTELKLRKGLISLKDLTEKQIEVFNRVTKHYPENILVRPFIRREHEKK